MGRWYQKGIFLYIQMDTKLSMLWRRADQLTAPWSHRTWIPGKSFSSCWTLTLEGSPVSCLRHVLCCLPVSRRILPVVGGCVIGLLSQSLIRCAGDFFEGSFAVLVPRVVLRNYIQVSRSSVPPPPIGLGRRLGDNDND